MHNRPIVMFYVLFLCLTLLLNACGEKAPAEPTPDLQAKLNSDTQMETWFTDIRLAFFFASEGLANIDDALLAKERSEDETVARNLIEHFNAPGNLVESLSKIVEKAESTKASIASVSGLDQESFSNLSELNKSLTATLKLMSSIPDNPADFREQVGTQKSKFTSVENLLSRKFPNSTAKMAQRKAPESPEFRKFKQLLEPRFEPAAEPLKETKDASEPAKPAQESAPENAQVSPNETPAPSKVWRDAQGNIHMGQAPPDGVVVEEPRGSIAQGSLVPPPTPAPTPTSSVAPAAVAPATQLVKDETGRITLKNIAEPTPETPAAN